MYALLLKTLQNPCHGPNAKMATGPGFNKEEGEISGIGSQKEWSRNIEGMQVRQQKSG